MSGNYDIQWQMQFVKDQQQNISGEIQSIQSDLKQLEKAHGELDSLSQEVQNNKTKVSQIPILHAEWRGLNADNIFCRCYNGEVSESFDIILSGVENAQEIIERKKQELQLQLSNKESTMFYLNQSLEVLKNEQNKEKN